MYMLIRERFTYKNFNEIVKQDLVIVRNESKRVKLDIFTILLT